ncbi:hypothetical protein BEWA_019650 [Theileria equi strain WA]|uniref:Potassium channel domain-containing protein n=1 Tax=Theileria equi strain WA TaxID=1537102 RepID=L0AW42_THEEQ|nr:hypothetical protein BEWA_019650 [Theileria equi strain WA]AFZ79119.1 hypothetical protein BEWA_019650 [Theileria equi strain WA]|eukprot:XP_004828785.1 hypothetical protein BEWA_019650 [Theileria equi strain WA]
MSSRRDDNTQQVYHRSLSLIRQPSYLENIDSNKYSLPKIHLDGTSVENRRSFVDKVSSYVISNKLDKNEQNLSKYKWVIFFDGLRIWIKTNYIQPVLFSKVWVVSNLLVTLLWFIVWEWAAKFMERNEGDFNLLSWSMDKIPHSYWYLEASFQLIFCLSFILNLYVSDWRCKYILSFFGLIDIIMTPILTEIMGHISNHYGLIKQTEGFQNLGLLFFGSLRFLRLLQAESLISKSFNWLPEFYVAIIGIATASFALLFSYSGIIFLIEAPIPRKNYTKPFDFIFFGVATMGTVGYGDFVPTTVYGRIVSIFFILTCVTLGAIQFKRLKAVISKKNLMIGYDLDLSYDYIFFWGPISDCQLLTYCKCISNTYYGAIENVVVASPLPLDYYEIVYMAITKNTRIKLYIIGGNEKIIGPSYASKLILSSAYTVIVNDMTTVDIQNFSDHLINDDRKTIMMALASLNITKPLGIPLGIHLHGTEYKSLLKAMSIDNVFYERELKYKLFSRSVKCKGLFYLLMTLFYTPTNAKRTRICVEELCNLFLLSGYVNEDFNEKVNSDEEALKISIYDVQNQMFELIKGMKFQLFKFKFPKVAKGWRFHDLVTQLYSMRNVFLIGIVSGNTCVLNPTEYIIGDELNYDDQDEYYGLIMAESLREVLKVSLLNFVPNDSFCKKDLMSGKIMKRASSISNLPTVSETNNTTDAPKYRGIFKVPSFSYAQSNVFIHPHQILLICGWTHDLDMFLKILFEYNDYNVIILSPFESVEVESPKSLDEYVERTVYIDGSALNAQDLINSGVYSCENIIIFNCNQNTGKPNSEMLSKDSQVLFARNLIQQILMEHQNYNKKNKIPHIISDVTHASCLEYLDPYLMANMNISCENDATNRYWDNYGEFMTSYEIASGTIFIQDMFYGILSHSNTNSENSVGHNCLDSILFGGELSIGNRIVKGGDIRLEPIAISFYGKTFENLIKYYLLVEQRICIGILRTYFMPFINHGTIKQFVIVAPQPSFILQPNDKIYIVDKSTLKF